jgi:hypothetical protein
MCGRADGRIGMQEVASHCRDKWTARQMADIRVAVGGQGSGRARVSALGVPELVPLEPGRAPSFTAGLAIHGLVGISRADLEPAAAVPSSRVPAPVATSPPKFSLGTFDTAATGGLSEDGASAAAAAPSDGAFMLSEAAPGFFPAVAAAVAAAVTELTGVAALRPKLGGPATGLRPVPLAEELAKRWREAAGASSAETDVAGPPLVRRGVASAYADELDDCGSGTSPFFATSGRTATPLPALKNLCLVVSCASNAPAGIWIERRAVDAPPAAERGVGVGVAEGGWRGSKCAAR